jgi:DNA-binding MarR family transcriptional regulator
MAAKPMSVATHLSFALYGAANRMVRLHKPILEPLGLTFPQYLVVLELFNVAPLSVGSLGARLDMDTGTITPLVKRLEVAGLVTRTRDPADERRVLVDLTARAAGMEQDVRSVTDQIKTACRLSEADLDRLSRSLEALAHSANE